MSDEEKEKTPHEQAVWFWRLHADLKRSTDPKRKAAAPVVEITAMAWDRIAKRQEQEGNGNDAA